METRAARDSCDTNYHDAQSSAGGDDTVSEQGSATHEGPAASETSQVADAQSEWISELIGKSAAMRANSVLVRTDYCKPYLHTGLLWVRGSELREAFHKVAWDLLPDLLQESSPPWMHSIKLTRSKCT